VLLTSSPVGRPEPLDSEMDLEAQHKVIEDFIYQRGGCAPLTSVLTFARLNSLKHFTTIGLIRYRFAVRQGQVVASCRSSQVGVRQVATPSRINASASLAAYAASAPMPVTEPAHGQMDMEAQLEKLEAYIDRRGGRVALSSAVGFARCNGLRHFTTDKLVRRHLVVRRGQVVASGRYSQVGVRQVATPSRNETFSAVASAAEAATTSVTEPSHGQTDVESQLGKVEAFIDRRGGHVALSSVIAFARHHSLRHFTTDKLLRSHLTVRGDQVMTSMKQPGGSNPKAGVAAARLQPGARQIAMPSGASSTAGSVMESASGCTQEAVAATVRTIKERPIAKAAKIGREKCGSLKGLAAADNVWLKAAAAAVLGDQSVRGVGKLQAAMRLRTVVAAILRAWGGRGPLRALLGKVQELGLAGITRGALARAFIVEGSEVALRPAQVQEAVLAHLRKEGGVVTVNNILTSKRLGLRCVLTKDFIREHFAVDGKLVRPPQLSNEKPGGVAMAKELDARLFKAARKYAQGDAVEARRIVGTEIGHIYSSVLRRGQLRGDPVFSHPYVRCLLEAARAHVREVLAQLPEPDSRKWVLCVRTYGRSGNPPGFPCRTGKSRKGVVQLTLAALEQALGPKEAHKRCLIFISHEDDDFTSGRLGAALQGTAWERRVVQGVKGADLQVRFIEESFPLGAHVVIADDNIQRFVVESAPKTSLGGNRTLDVEHDVAHAVPTLLKGTTSELAGLIARAGTEMEARGTNIWSVSGTCNHYVLFRYGVDCRKKAAKTGIFQDFSEKLGLIYGAFFGIRVLKDAARYTRYGQVKDDVERTLRYWHCDRAMIRFRRYSVEKTHKPGKFGASKGGISAASSGDAHAAETAHALRAMLVEFANPYARLPAKGDRAHCGLIFINQKRSSAGRRQTVCRPAAVPTAVRGQKRRRSLEL